MSSISPPFFEQWSSARAPQLSAFLQPLDFCTPLLLPLSTVTLGKPISNFSRLWRPIAPKDDYNTSIKVDEQNFEATLDVQQFAPREIMVKIIGRNNIVVEAKHEEKQDQYGSVARQFLRRYILPDGHDLDNVISSLSSDGILTITAPRLEELEEHRSVPVLQTGTPATRVTTADSMAVPVNAHAKVLIASVGKVSGAAAAKPTETGPVLGETQKPDPETKKISEVKEEKQADEKKN